MEKNSNLQVKSLLHSKSTVVIDKTNINMSSYLQAILIEDGKQVSVLDARTLYDRFDLRKKLNQIPEGYLIIDHITEVPQSEQQEIILDILRACLKADYTNAGENVIFGSEEWKRHFADTKIKIIAIVRHDDFKTLLYKNVVPMGCCAHIGITDEEETTGNMDRNLLWFHL